VIEVALPLGYEIAFVAEQQGGLSEKWRRRFPLPVRETLCVPEGIYVLEEGTGPRSLRDRYARLYLLDRKGNVLAEEDGEDLRCLGICDDMILAGGLDPKLSWVEVSGKRRKRLAVGWDQCPQIEDAPRKIFNYNHRLIMVLSDAYLYHCAFRRKTIHYRDRYPLGKYRLDGLWPGRLTGADLGGERLLLLYEITDLDLEGCEWDGPTPYLKGLLNFYRLEIRTVFGNLEGEKDWMAPEEAPFYGALRDVLWWGDQIVLLTEKGISVFDPEKIPSRPLERIVFEYEEAWRLIKAPPFLFVCGSGEYAILKWEKGAWKRMF